MRKATNFIVIVVVVVSIIVFTVTCSLSFVAMKMIENCFIDESDNRSFHLNIVERTLVHGGLRREGNCRGRIRCGCS